MPGVLLPCACRCKYLPGLEDVALGYARKCTPVLFFASYFRDCAAPISRKPSLVLVVETKWSLINSSLPYSFVTSYCCSPGSFVTSYCCHLLLLLLTSYCTRVTLILYLEYCLLPSAEFPLVPLQASFPLLPTTL